MKKKPSAEPLLLVGDVGGTNSRLALYAPRGKKAVAEKSFLSREHPSLEAIVDRFLLEAERPALGVAVFGVAGPVHKGVATITNLHWRIEEKSLQRRLGARRVLLTNDLAVIARGCVEVSQRDRVLLTSKAPEKKGSNLAVIAAGTGLGEARLVWIGDRHVVLPTEGGHTDFAARTPLEVELWSFLRTRYPDHVSYERVLSGAGLGAIYDFFVARSGPEPESVARRLAEGDRNKEIAELGLSGAYPPAAHAVDLFVTIYGAEAGNLVLGELAMGGLFVAGNIARTLVPARRELFMEGFLRKGRFAAKLADVPVAVITDSMVGLRGAHALARELAAEGGTKTSTKPKRSAISAFANGSRRRVSPRSQGRKR